MGEYMFLSNVKMDFILIVPVQFRIYSCTNVFVIRCTMGNFDLQSLILTCHHIVVHADVYDLCLHV